MHHLDESLVQRSVRRCGEVRVDKHATRRCDAFSQSLATHVSENGYDSCTVQVGAA